MQEAQLIEYEMVPNEYGEEQHSDSATAHQNAYLHYLEAQQNAREAHQDSSI